MFENVLFFMMGGRVWSFEKRTPWVNRQEARTRQSLAPSGFWSWLLRQTNESKREERENGGIL